MGNSKLIMGTTAAGGNRLLVPVVVDADGYLQIDVLTLPSIPPGSNNIGDVDVLSLPSIPAGTNNIGDVDVLTLPSIPAGANRIGSIGIEGYYNAGWRKAPIPFGASAPYGQNWQNLSLPAGASNQDSGALQANALTIITSWSVRYVGTVLNVTLTATRMAGGTTAYTIFTFRSLATNVWFNIAPLQIVCDPTDILRIAVANATLNDDLYVSVNGYYLTTNL